jgi:multiple sugar transport system permease protein
MLLGRWLHALGLAAVVAFAVFPFYWMVSSSMKDQATLLASPPAWLFRPTLANYAAIFADQTVTHGIVNSLIVAVCTTALAVALGTPAAYALARFEFRGKADLWFWFISNRMVSPIVLALPIYLLARQLRLLDTHLVLILIYLTFNLPIVVWICTGGARRRRLGDLQLHLLLERAALRAGADAPRRADGARRRDQLHVRL